MLFATLAGGRSKAKALWLVHSELKQSRLHKKHSLSGKGVTYVYSFTATAVPIALSFVLYISHVTG